MVYANGFPKSGNHALVKALQLLGVPCEVNHQPFGSPVSGRHIFIKRDPRNVVCSWLRFTGNPVTPGMFLTAFRRFGNRPLIDAMAEYEGWLADRHTHVVKYEDLISSDEALKVLATVLGIPYIEGAFDSLPGLTSTWYSEHSDYRSIWAPAVDAAWEAEGGPDLLERWGY